MCSVKGVQLAEWRAKNNEVFLEQCLLCGLGKGSLRLYRIECPQNSLLASRNQMRGIERGYLFAEYNRDKDCPVGSQVSPRLVTGARRSGLVATWPLLCYGPYLLPTNDETSLLAGWHDKNAEDMAYRGVWSLIHDAYYRR